MIHVVDSAGNARFNLENFAFTCAVIPSVGVVSLYDCCRRDLGSQTLSIG